MAERSHNSKEGASWFRVGPPRRTWAALIAATFLLMSCGPGIQGPTSAVSNGLSSGTRQEAQFSATAPPTPVGQQPANEETSLKQAKPQVVPGTGVTVGAAPARTHVAAASTGPGGISFNFVNADVREVLRDILGGQLHLNYTVDPKVQALITVQTGAPLPRDAVLAMLENVLQANGIEMVKADDVYRVLPSTEAAKATLPAVGTANGSTYGMRILPLRYASATQLKSVLAPFVPPGSVLQVDTARNVLIITGSAADLDGFTDLVRQFDVDWLAGTSYALYPLQVATAKDVANELTNIFGESGNGPLADVVRIVPIERLNAILVITTDRAYLAKVKAWIDRLDYGSDQTTPRLFVYHVQNSRAADLAAVLTKLFSSGQVQTVQPEVAPGSKLAVQMAQQGIMGAAQGATALGTSGTASVPGSPAIGTTPNGLPNGAITAQGGATTGAAPAAPAGETGQAQPEAGTTPGSSAPELPPVRIVADETNNALVIYARPRDYKMIEQTIRNLDIVPLQVLIRATIAEVTLNHNLQYGLQWFLSHASNHFELSTGASGSGIAGDILPTFPGFNYIVGGGREKAILDALSQVTNVNVVSSPHLLVLNHQTAALQVGDQVPIITQSAESVITSGAPIVNSVAYLNTGVILQVTPRVNANGQITLDIDQSVSDVAQTTTSTIDSPTINQRRIVTNVVVQDGETVALGGLISDNNTNGRSGLPILSDIPVVGSLFGTTTNTGARTELLVLLTPEVIRNATAARTMTDELRDRMQALKPFVAARP